jgi:hypothetical protein
MTAAGTAARTLWISRFVFRRWAATTGVTPVSFATLLTVPAAGVGALSLWLVSIREATPSDVAVDLFLFGVCLVVFLAAWGFGIFGAHASEITFRELLFLRVRPVGPAVLRVGARIPVTVVGLLLLVALGPAAFLAVSRQTGYGMLHAAVSLLLLTLAGTSMGRLSYALAGVLNRLLRAASLRLSVACLAWLGWAIGGLLLFNWSLRHGGAGFTPVLRVGALVWPLGLWLVLTAQPWAYAVMSVVTLALVGAATLLRPARVDAGTGGLIRRGFDPARPLLLTRLLMLRLWRHPRGREWVLVGAFFSLLSCAAMLYARLRVPFHVDLWVVRVLALQTGLSFGVLTRGLSARHRPVEAQWLFSPAAHVRAAFAAVVCLGALATSPVLVGLAADVSVQQFALYVSVLVLQAAIAVGLSFALVPRLGSGGVEFLSMVVYLAVSFLAVAGLQKLPDAPTRAGAGALCCLAALALAVVLETRRRAPRIRPTAPTPQQVTP